jgi:katanin p60 ATPase-containing subunit A1
LLPSSSSASHSSSSSSASSSFSNLQNILALDQRSSHNANSQGKNGNIDYSSHGYEVKSLVLSSVEDKAGKYSSRQKRNNQENSFAKDFNAFNENMPVPKPPYNGDDKRLVEIIENDMIERKLNVKFEDIAALEDAKRLVNEAVVIPLLLPEFFTGIRQPWRGVLLHGPPGTGKTMLARAVADKAQTTFFNVSSSTIVSKWHGESEKLVRVLFNMARYYSPSIVFFDEVDALTSVRGGSGEHEASRRLKSEIFSQLDGVTSGSESQENPRVMVLATTNRPWDLDDAFRRRLEKRIYVPLPDQQAREKIFSLCLKDIKVDDDVSIEEIARLCDNYSGSDVHLLCRDWSMAPFRRLVEGKSTEEISALRNSSKLDFTLSMADFNACLKHIKPSVNLKDIQKFELWQHDFGAI